MASLRQHAKPRCTRGSLSFLKNGYPGSVVDTIMAGLLKPDAGKASSETGEAKQHVVIRLPWPGPVTSNGFCKEIRDMPDCSSKSGFHYKASI